MKQSVRIPFPPAFTFFHHQLSLRPVFHILLILALIPMGLSSSVESVLAEKSRGSQPSTIEAQADQAGPVLVIQADDFEPGKDTHLAWEIAGGESAKSEAAWSLHFILPTGWEPVDTKEGKFDPLTSTLVIQVTSLKGRLSLHTSHDSGEAAIHADLLDGDTLVASASTSMTARHTGKISRSGGEVTGRVGKRDLKIKAPKGVVSEEVEIRIQSPQTLPASLPPNGKDPFELLAAGKKDGKSVHQFTGWLEIEIGYDPEGENADPLFLSIYFFDESLNRWIPLATTIDRERKVLKARTNHFSLFALGVDTGRGHSCVVTDDGGVKCWGDNYYGQLGDGTTTHRSEPVDVVGLSSGVSQVVVGGHHTCALTSTSGVKCWGDNGWGQLGNGAIDQELTPVDVSGLTSGVIALAAGAEHTCALTSSGGVKCWGLNSDGQLGDGTTEQSLTPVNVSGLTSGITQITGGEYHTCALTSSGGLKCWGWNEEGQLGDGTTDQRLTPVTVNGMSSGITTMAAGYGFTCALTGSGGMKCWGDNYYGQLGDGTGIQRLTPVDVSGLTSGVATLATGYFHACAVISGGGAKCWGWNAYGQIGDGTTTQRLSPVDVSGLTSGVTAITAGSIHTCALTSAGAMCWGGNQYGQLGNGTPIYQLTPVDVSGMSSGIAAIGTGYAHSCALTSGGGVKCWGWNEDGQLGNDTTTRWLTPVDVSGLSSGASAVAAGYLHSCALTSSGGVKCWGNNYYGQLGDGTITQRLTPVNVSGLSSGVTAISAGMVHTCVLTSSGGVKCWGDNSAGQLGDGTLSTRLTPVTVSGLGSGVIDVAAGYGHTCALTSSGGVKCWGWNGSGQLGDGTNNLRLTPTDVVGLSSGVIGIEVGYKHSCALLSGGSVKCWGENSWGQLGDGTNEWQTTPVDVTGLSGGASALTAGSGYTCAVTSSGGAKCWGLNDYGQLGDGTFTEQWTPVDVSDLSSGAAAIAAGFQHTCALTTGGGAKCWGNNVDSQLGDGTPIQSLTPVYVVGPNDITLTITTASPYIEPGSTVTIDWQVGGYDPTAITTTLVFSVPSGFTPVNSGGTFDPVAQTLSLPVTSLSGQATWEVDSTADDPFTITARLFEQTNELENAEVVLSWQPVTSWESDLPHAYFGHSIAQADVNGNGYNDLIVGAPGYDGTGAVFIYYGAGNSFNATPDLMISGQSDGDRYGWSVSSAGDINDDGYEDVVISAIGYSQPETYEGCAYVYYGSPSGLSATPAWTIEGNQSYAAFGYVVGTAGDVNGDGISDLFIGAPNYSNGEVNEGKLDVYYGYETTAEVPTEPNWTAEGGQPYAYFGLSAAAAGDATGDAIDDLIVGAPNASGDLDHEGKVYLYAGAVGGLSTISTWTIEGNQAEAHLGEALSAGDLTGDGIQDIIVGAPDYDDGETDEGAVFVYFSTPSGHGIQPGWSATSNQAYASFGVAVSFINDVEDDNVHGLAIGANRFDDGEADEGRVFLYYTGSGGIDPNRLWTVDGDQAFANFGYDIDKTCDQNGSNVCELLIGNPQKDTSLIDGGEVLASDPT